MSWAKPLLCWFRTQSDTIATRDDDKAPYWCTPLAGAASAIMGNVCLRGVFLFLGHQQVARRT